MKLNLSPSMMLADFLNLESDMNALYEAGCHSYHIDVMDGNYVPNITLGMMDIAAMNKVAKIPLEIHLMVNEPSNVLDLFNLENVSTIMVHPEICTHLHRTLIKIKSMNKRVGLVINPSTPLSFVEEVIEELDCVMLMSVNPGYAGQTFIESSYIKLERLKSLIDSYKKDIEILVDGSISTKNINKLYELGATGFILGSASIFRNNRDYKNNLKELIGSFK